MNLIDHGIWLSWESILYQYCLNCMIFAYLHAETSQNMYHVSGVCINIGIKSFPLDNTVHTEHEEPFSLTPYSFFSLMSSSLE